MGYRSDVVIAIHNVAYTHCLLLNNFPELLKDSEKQQINNAFFWQLDLKWYDSYPEIQAMEAFFAYLDSLNDVENHLDFNDLCAFGAMRLGEDADDVETWGNPQDFDIYHSSYINSPVNSDHS